MEEEVSKKTVHLAWQPTKVTVRRFYKFLKSYVEERQKESKNMMVKKDSPVKGK